ncbi:hypothetical protein [Metabacillus idriensis]|uniref:hypothetical protein n=1 Tax=Metabacillus idriensis TaxID=324768 RepID=UPI00174EB183|nr:hypothetical protein [Metabacillus idriensis]
MNPILKSCMLSSEQRNLILQGIKQGKDEFQSITALHPATTTRTYLPRFQYDLVNTYVEKVIKDNPHTQMKVYTKKAGFHPYIVIQDQIRNIFILVLKLPKNKYIFNQSEYRGDFASSNIERLVEMGVPKSELVGDTPYQESLPLGMENQPFSIIVCYDGKSDIVYEGALRPDQEDWLYKEDITDYVNMNIEKLVPVNSYNLTDIEPTLKTPKADEDIVLKLKTTTSS